MTEIEKYIETIIQMDIFADSVLIVDQEGYIRHFSIYRNVDGQISGKDALGKNILELYPNLTKETSTVCKALRGITTTQQLTAQINYRGKIITLLESDFPIKKDGKIIGAISVGKYTEAFQSEINIEEDGKKKTRLYSIDDIIGDSTAVQRLKSQILLLAKTNSSVLICGETGTGKELTAQAIHSAGKRRSSAFFVQNCAAIPSNLLESIFFGTAKGSYTGAVDRAGLFESAHGGTIFLDEINSMDYGLQAKLLRVIESKTVTRIGSFTEIPVDVRLLAATNIPPEECLTKNVLREDLYYRLSTVQIRIPPLRERKSDIPILCDRFVAQYNRDMNKNIDGIEAAAMACLQSYPWPGNIRELKNVIESAFNFTDYGMIEKDKLPDQLTHTPLMNIPELTERGELIVDKLQANTPSDQPSLKAAVENFEKNYILEKLAGCRSYTMLADQLKISPQALHYKLKKYGIRF